MQKDFSAQQLDRLPVAALPALLEPAVSPERYAPLRRDSARIASALLAAGVCDSRALLALGDAALSDASGLPPEQAALLRRFFRLYAFKDRRLAELSSVSPPFLAALAADGVVSSGRYLLLACHDGADALARRYGADAGEAARLFSLCDLMRLPGVKHVRANLYHACGFPRVQDFIGQDAARMRETIARGMEERAIHCAVPLLKELRTQIAVAAALPRL